MKIENYLEIIPAINVPTFEEVKERVKKVEPFVTWCHLDVTDGVFSKHLTWHDARDLPLLHTSLYMEVHLMVEEPEKIIDQWLVFPVRRIIVQVEAVKDMELLIRKCREAKKEIGLAVGPETFWGQLEPWFGRVDMVQVLAVCPGPSGQKMAEGTIEKITHLRNSCPSCILEVDGGITFESASLVKNAGADILVAGSMIFASEDVGMTIEKLKNHG